MRTLAVRPWIGRFARACAGLTLLAAAPSAHANVYNDVVDFNLSEATSTYSSYVTTSSSGIQYRWVDSPWKVTYISSASCYNNAPYGEAGYPSAYTAYLGIGTLPAGWCFNLRGRTAPGSGTMFYYDGRVSR